MTIEELKNRPTLEKLDFHQCRYPLGEYNDPPKYFCGHNRYKNYSYCKPHVELCTDKKEFDLNNKPWYINNMTNQITKEIYGNVNFYSW